MNDTAKAATMGNPIAELVKRARSDGWATGTIDLFTFKMRLAHPDWAAVPNRVDGQLIDVLRPVDETGARRHSLSAMTGTRAQPLHTDGAHHRTPPDVIMLHASSPSDVHTFLWKRPRGGLPASLRNDLRHGLFTVEPGHGDAFLAHAFDLGRFRYDPGCMTPADSRAHRVAEYFAGQRESAVTHSWDAPDLVLAIDNRHVLHARGDATAEPDRTLHRFALRMTQEAR